MKQYETIFDYRDVNRLIVMSGGTILCFTLLYIPAMAAKAIISERKKHNLDLLLLAVPNPICFLWNKLLAVISVYLMILFSSLPVLAVVFSLGGSGISIYIKMFMQFFTAALLSGSVALLFSSIAKLRLISAFWSYVTLILYSFTPLLICRFSGFTMWRNALLNGCQQPRSIFLGNPVVTFYYFISPQRAEFIRLYRGIHFYRDWTFRSMLVQIIGCIVFTVASAYILKPFHLPYKKRK